METTLEIEIRAFDEALPRGELAARAFAVIEAAGLTADATHYTHDYSSRARRLDTLRDPFTENHHELAVFEGRSGYAGRVNVRLFWRYDLRVRIAWQETPADLLERLDGLAIAMDEALGRDVLFFFPHANADVDPILQGPARWHRWMKAPAFWDAWDLRLRGAVDRLPEIVSANAKDATLRRTGNLLLVHWTSKLDVESVRRAIGEREAVLADAFHWPLEDHDTESMGSERFPRATNSWSFAPPQDLSPAVGELVKAATRGHHKKVFRLLEALSPSEIGESLGPVLATGEVELAEALLDLGADVDFVGALGWTPLMWATDGRRVEAVRWLLDVGADPSPRSHRDEMDALMIAVHDRSLEYRARRSPKRSKRSTEQLHGAMRAITSMLITAGAALDATDRNGNTAFHAAAASGHLDLCRMLLAAGADPLHRDAEGASALELLAVRGSVAFVREVAGRLHPTQ